MTKSKLILVTLISTLTSCAWFDQSEHEKIVGDYKVGWNDMVRNRAISRPTKDCDGCDIVLVPPYVYAVGHNDDFIIAKQQFGPGTTQIYYYIIDIKKNVKYGYSKGVYGALNEVQFDSLRIKLNISHIPFHINYPINP